MLAGKHHGKIKAHDERGNIVTVAGPSTRFQFLVLMEQQLRVINSIFLKMKKRANKLLQNVLKMREQSVRTQRHITLDEIGRRISRSI
jgi:translation initiation factor IF-2